MWRQHQHFSQRRAPPIAGLKAIRTADGDESVDAFLDLHAVFLAFAARAEQPNQALRDDRDDRFSLQVGRDPELRQSGEGRGHVVSMESGRHQVTCDRASTTTFACSWSRNSEGEITSGSARRDALTAPIQVQVGEIVTLAALGTFEFDGIADLINRAGGFFLNNGEDRFAGV